jgi:hypothetical protein
MCSTPATRPRISSIPVRTEPDAHRLVPLRRRGSADEALRNRVRPPAWVPLGLLLQERRLTGYIFNPFEGTPMVVIAAGVSF